ncbi:hypothetical protein P8452_51742 [Trifolium repens]|nr:hypothetical protein P8452_51742 [Trifolium repens]
MPLMLLQLLQLGTFDGYAIAYAVRLCLPDKKIYEILDTVLAAHNKLQRAKKQKKVDWLFPTSQKLVMSAAISS